MRIINSNIIFSSTVIDIKARGFYLAFVLCYLSIKQLCWFLYREAPNKKVSVKGLRLLCNFSFWTLSSGNVEFYFL